MIPGPHCRNYITTCYLRHNASLNSILASELLPWVGSREDDTSQITRLESPNTRINPINP